MTLDTPRLSFRRFTDTDEHGALLLELDSDPEVMRYIGPFRLTTVEAYRERIRTRYRLFDAGPFRGTWATFEKATGEFIGWFFLRPATAHIFAKEAGFTRDTDLELGYRFRRVAWGRGLATEGATELVRRALADPKVTGVVATAVVLNRGSIRVMEKAGLTFVREFMLPASAGFTDPSVVYARSREGCEPR